MTEIVQISSQMMKFSYIMVPVKFCYDWIENIGNIAKSHSGYRCTEVAFQGRHYIFISQINDFDIIWENRCHFAYGIDINKR